MAQRDTKTRTTGGSGPSGRPPLEPADPLPGSTALVQLALLLGIPIGLLLLAKVVIAFFHGTAH